MCVGRDLKQLLDLDEAKCKQSSAAAVPPWLPFSFAPPQAQLPPAQICEMGSFPLYPDRKRKSHQTAPGGRTGCVSGPCQLRMGMQSWLLQGRNGIINTSCVIAVHVWVSCLQEFIIGLNGFYPNCSAAGFAFRSSGCAWRGRAVGAVGFTGQDGKPMENCQHRSASNRATSLKSLVCIASTSSWYLWVNWLLCAASPRILLLFQSAVSESFPPKLCYCAGNTESQAADFGHIPSLCWKNRLLVAVNRLNRNCSLIKGVRSAYSMSRMFWNLFGACGRNNC